MVLVVVAGVGVGVVAAGSPARGTVAVPADDVLGRARRDVDPATFPSITVEQDVSDWNHEIAGPVAQQLVLDLVENLELENQALLRVRRDDPPRRRPRRPARRDAVPARGGRGDAA